MILMLGLMLFSVAHASTPNAGLTAKVDVNSSQYWSSYKIVVTNVSSQAIDMKDSTIDIISDSDQIKSLDNVSADGLSWALFTLTNAEQGGSYLTEVKMNFPEGDWVVTKLAPGKTITITFGNSAAINIQTVNVYTNGDNPNPPEPAKNDASLTITAPVIADASDNVSATVTGPNGYTSTESIQWGASKTISDLPYGHYVVRTNSVGDYTGGSDQSADFSALNKTSTVTLQYTKPVVPAKAIFHINAVADTTAPVQTLTFQVEGDSSSMKIMNATWVATLEQDSLVSGSTYNVWLTSFKSKGFNYTPNCLQATPCTFVADKNNPQVVEVTYQAAALPTGNVTLNVTGLPEGSAAVIKLMGDDGLDYSNNMSNGSQILNVVSEQYQVSADPVNADGKTYKASLTNSYKLDNGSTLMITYQVQAPAKARLFGVFWSGWSNPSLDATNKKVDAVYLAFSNITGAGNQYNIDTSVSGYIADVPAVGSQIWPSYLK